MLNFLKLIRLEYGMTQSDVAKTLNLSVRQYRRIESGKSFPNRENLNKLEDLFQLPQRVLLAKSIEEVPDFYKPYLEKLEKRKD